MLFQKFQLILIKKFATGYKMIYKLHRASFALWKLGLLLLDTR